MDTASQLTVAVTGKICPGAGAGRAEIPLEAKDGRPQNPRRAPQAKDSWVLPWAAARALLSSAAGWTHPDRTRDNGALGGMIMVRDAPPP